MMLFVFNFKISTEALDGNEVFKYKLPVPNETEPEVRRMSDLSDWAPSVASSVDIQVHASLFYLCLASTSPNSSYSLFLLQVSRLETPVLF